MPLPLTAKYFLDFMQFLGNFGKIVCGIPPPTENPGSAPDFYANYFYRSFYEVLAKVIFSQACVILSTGGGGVVVWLGRFSKFWGFSKFSGGVSPIFGGSTNFRLGVSNFPGGGIRSTFGRYASYWNAFLF